MTTLAEEIARCLEEGYCCTAVSGSGKRHPGLPLTDEDKAFLRRWADALDRSEWKRNATKIKNPDRLILRVIGARRSAEADNGRRRRENDKLWHSLQEHQALANMADRLLDYYERVFEAIGGGIDDVAGDHLAYLIECQSAVASDLHKDFYILYEGSSPYVHASNNTTERERMLFMQHLSRRMKDSLGRWHDPMVAAITSLMYQVSVSKKAVERHREKLLKNATPPFPPEES